MSFSDLFNQAVDLALKQVRSGEFSIQSEKDIQVLLFHHVLTLAEQTMLPLDVHAEPTKARLKPDLVLGADEVFVETKLAKAGSGGYTQALAKWHEDVAKLRRYKEHWPTSRCVFFAVDESGYHSSPSLANFFDPKKASLRGSWSPLSSYVKYLVAEV